VILMDMSGSMRYDGQYVHVKRMALALDGLIRREYPGDYLQFIEMYTFAKPRALSEIATLMPKPVTVFEPGCAAEGRHEPRRHERVLHSAALYEHSAWAAAWRKFSGHAGHANRQIILITDGLPTAHFEGSILYLLYPPDPTTEAATMREGQLCQRERITINIFLLPSWSQNARGREFRAAVG